MERRFFEWQQHEQRGGRVSAISIGRRGKIYRLVQRYGEGKSLSEGRRGRPEKGLEFVCCRSQMITSGRGGVEQTKRVTEKEE